MAVQGFGRADGPSQDAGASGPGRPAAPSPSLAPVVRWAAVALLAAFGYVGLTIAYTDGRVFDSASRAFADTLSHTGATAAVGALLFPGLMALCALGLGAMRRSPTSVRVWSVVCGAAMAATLTATPHTLSSAPMPRDVFEPVPPLVEERYRTVWYGLYLLVKFAGSMVVATACVAIVLAACARARARGASVASFPALLSDDARARLRRSAASARAACEPLLRRFTVFRWRNVVLLGGVILVCWLPWLVLMYPVNLGPDTIAQLVWARTGRAWDPSSRLALPGYAMSDHHPWLDTVIYGAFDAFGRSIGNVEVGLWLMVLAHAVLIAFALGCMLCHLGSRMAIAPHWCAAGLAFYALMPAFGRLNAAVVKDLTCMPFLLLWLVAFMEYVRRIRARARIGAGFMAGFLALALLCSLTRRLSLYIIAATLLCCALLLRRRVLSALAAAVLVAAMAVIPQLVFPVLRVAPAGAQEMLAIPLQQGAHLLLKEGDALSAHDRRAIEQVFSCPPERIAKVYSPGGSDTIKDCFNRAADQRQVRGFLAVWAAQGVRHPGTYLEAVPWLRDPFTMGRLYDEHFQVWWGWEDRGGGTILPAYASHERSKPQYIGSKLYEGASRLPVVGLLMNLATYTVWAPMMCVALCFVRGRRRNLVLMLPFLWTIASLLICPAYQPRYSWTLMYGAVMMMAIPFVRLPGIAGEGVGGEGLGGEGVAGTDAATAGDAAAASGRKEKARRS